MPRYPCTSTADMEAIKANDEQKARSRMYDHIIRSMENILTRFSA
ncbi:MAG: hypothetical protein ACLTTZ_08860 [Lachnospiraceae bacterium]